MKVLLITIAVFACMAVAGILPFSGTDVAKLEPIEAIAIMKEQNGIRVLTDTMEEAFGYTLNEAFRNLKETSSGQVFLETAQFLLIHEEMISILPELKTHIRPACDICLWDGQGEMEEVVPFLETHHPGLTLQKYLSERNMIPILKTIRGRMYLEQPKDIRKAADRLDRIFLCGSGIATGRKM